MDAWRGEAQSYPGNISRRRASHEYTRDFPAMDPVDVRAGNDGGGGDAYRDQYGRFERRFAAPCHWERGLRGHDYLRQQPVRVDDHVDERPCVHREESHD